MTRREIFDVQLDALFGARFPWKMQRLVDEELNRGVWVEGYDIAVSEEVIRIADAEKLLQIVLTQHPDLRIDREALQTTVEDRLPQSLGARVGWIVSESGAYALTDSLRVARFERNSLIWSTPRISFDGIEFDSLVDGRLRGRAWWLGSHESPDSPFEIDFETGELLVGQVVPC
ncbi:MAG: hypothetical protein AAF226_15355 [Verrucomicrobiota bacterium]